MNILFFLTPKANCAYLKADDSMRQALERMESARYSALPILKKDGSYCGTLTEGDLLWAIKNLCTMDIRATDRMEFWMTDEGMVLRKAEERCAVCGGVHGDMLDVDGMKFCRVCARKIARKLRTE